MKRHLLARASAILLFLFLSIAAQGQSITIISVKPQIESGIVMMSCATDMVDPTNYYPRGVEAVCEFHSVSAQGFDSVHTMSSTAWPNASASYSFSPIDPGATYRTIGTHYLWFSVVNKAPNDDPGCPDPYLLDILGYGNLTAPSGASSFTITPPGPPVGYQGWCQAFNPQPHEGFFNWRQLGQTKSDQVTTIRISPRNPPAIILKAGQTMKFSVNQAAKLTLSPSDPNTGGTIAADGTYTAPATVPVPLDVTLKAEDPGNPANFDQVTISLTSINIFVAPTSIKLNQGQTAEFSATDDSNAPAKAIWSTQLGTVTNAPITNPSTGSATTTYTAPASFASFQTDTVKAVSAADSSKDALASVTLQFATINITTPNNSQLPANAGSTIALTATLQNAVDPAPPPSACVWTLLANVTPPGTLSNQSCTGATYTVAAGLTTQQSFTVQVCYNGPKPAPCNTASMILVPPPLINNVTGTLFAGQVIPTVSIGGTGFGTSPTVVLTDIDTNTNLSFTQGTATNTSIALNNVVVPLGFKQETIRVSVANFIPSVGQAVGYGTATTSPATLTVTATATTTALNEGQQVQLSPTVTCKTGGGLACDGPTGITWKISPSIGSIDANNVYTATVTGLTSATSVAVQACSTTNTLSCSGSIGLQIRPVTITISPNNPTSPPTLTSGKTQQFAASVANPPYTNGAPNSAVSWSLNGSGSISSSTGLYTAPDTVTANETVTINACSQGDSSAVLCAHAPLKLAVQPDFAIVVGPPSVQLNGLGLLPANSQLSYPVTVTSYGGFSGVVSFAQLGGVPPGVSGFLSPSPLPVPVNGSATTTLTFNSTASPTVGSWTIGLTGSSGSLSHLAQIQFVVPQPSFTVSATPASQTVVAGASAQPYVVHVAPTYGFTGAVSLSLTGASGGALPAGVTASFSSSSVPGASGSPTLTLATTAATPQGTYTLNVNGTSGGQSKTATITLVVLIPDFVIAPINNPAGTLPGHSTFTKVTVSPVNGFTGNVTLSATNLPPGATYSFDPSSITGASGSSTLTLNIANSTPTNIYTITITATSGGLVHSDTVALEVGHTMTNNDPTLAFILNLPNQNVTLYGGDTLDFEALAPGVFPYPQTAVFKTLQSGGQTVKILSVNGIASGGMEITRFPTPQSPADGSPASSFAVLVHPITPVTLDVVIGYVYASDNFQTLYKSTIHLKAGRAFTINRNLLFHLEDESGNRLPMGAINQDGSESPVTGSYNLGIYGLNNTAPFAGVVRFLNVCNDSASPISMVRFWDDTPGDTVYTDVVAGPIVLRGLAPSQCGQVSLYGGNTTSGTFSAGVKIFVTTSPEPPRLDSGNIQWLPLQYTKVNSTIPAFTLKANNDRGFGGFRGQIDAYSSPKNQPFGRVYTITNSSQVSLTISGLKVTNSVGTAFSLLRNFSRTTLTPGQTATFQVRFWPKTAGPFAGYVDFTTNAVDNHYRFLLRGAIGSAPRSSLDVTQNGVEVYNGGTFDANGTLHFTLTNNGLADLQFSDLAVPANYQVDSGLPATLAPGAAADIQFTKMSDSDPQSPGAIMFSTSDPDDPSFEMDENAGPILQDDYAITPVNTPVTINVTANDIFQNATVVLTSAPITAPPSHGTAVRLSDSQVVYTPSQDFTGADTFTYQAVTPAGDTSTAFVYVTVGGPPANSLVALDDQATSDNGSAVDFNVLANDTGAPGKTLTISNPTVTQPLYGTVQVMGPGILRYLPAFSSIAEDAFIYEITDGQATARATVHVHLTQSIPPPYAVSDSATTPPNTAVLISPLDNDFDPYGGGLALPGTAIVTPPQNGTVALQGMTQILYTPNPGFTGFDLFQYRCTNGHGGFSSAWVGITVAVPPPPNYPPVAAPDSATTYINQAVIIPVTANDSDPDGDPVSLLGIVTQPGAGSVVILDSGNIRYTPNPYVAGTDTFVYQIHDGHGHMASGQVTVTIRNHPPVATPDFAQTNSSTAININVVANDTDAEQDPISLTSTPLVTPPTAGGIVTFVDSYTFNYKPKFGFVGNDTFTYQIQDLRGATATGTVTVTVVNRPPVAIGDTASTPFNTPVTINVLQNDSDPDGHALSLSPTPVVSGPALGATVTVSGNSLIYTPPSGFVGTDTFTYEMQDSYGAKARATVSVSIINRPPTAVPDTFTVVGSNPTQLAVLANDSDPDGEAISLVNNFVNPLHGVLAIDSYKYVFYTAVGCYVGTDTFKYYVQDSRGATSQGTATVNVTSDHLPVAVTDNITTPSGTFTTINVTANDCHPDNQRPYLDVNFPLYVQPSHGYIQLADNTTFYYTSFTGYHGTDSFQYNLRDAAGHYTVGTVNITIP
jgi:hypothetical protein